MGVCAIGFAVPVPADVLDDPDPDFSLEDTLKAGPFHVAPFFYLRDVGYDDNVRLGTDDKQGDYTLTIGPGARAVMPMGRRAALAFWDELDYVMYATQTDLNSVNNTLKAKGHLYLGHLTPYLEGEQYNIRQRPNFEIDFRIRDITTEGRLGARYKPEGRLAFDVAMVSTDYHYELGNIDVPSDLSDVDAEAIARSAVTSIRRLERTETGGRLGARLKIRPRTTLLVDVEREDVDFQYLTATASRDSIAHAGMLGLEFDPSGSFLGYLKLGVKDLNPDSQNLEGFHGPIADMAVSLRVLGRGDIRAGYRRNTGFSTLGDNLYYILDRKGLGYEHYVTGRLSLGAEYALNELDYPVDLEGQVPPHRKDDVVESRLTVKYRFGPSLRVGLAFSRWDRDSTIDSEDEDRNTITTLLEYTP